jgi:hypothetical protein
VSPYRKFKSQNGLKGHGKIGFGTGHAGAFSQFFHTSAPHAFSPAFNNMRAVSPRLIFFCSAILSTADLVFGASLIANCAEYITGFISFTLIT